MAELKAALLPLLPLVLTVLVRAVERQRHTTLMLLAIGLLGFVQQPCYLPFPNLWTLAALFLWAICVWNNGLFRASSNQAGGVPHGDQ